MDYEKLKTEISGLKYSMLSDEDTSKNINTKNIESKQAISTHDIKEYLMISGVWLGIKNSKSDAGITAMDALLQFESFDITEPLIASTLDVILTKLVNEVSVPDFVGLHKIDVLAMGDKTISRADELGIGRVSAGHVQAVRRRMK